MKCVKKVKCFFDLCYLSEKYMQSFGTIEEALWEGREQDAFEAFCDTYRACFEALDKGKCDALIMKCWGYGYTMVSPSVKHDKGYQITSFSSYRGRLDPTMHIHTTIENICFRELPETDIFMVTF